MLVMKRLSVGATLATLAMLAAAPASATIISAPSSLASCNGYGGVTVNGCTDTISYSTNIATSTTPFIAGLISGQDAINADFTTAFDNWNVANGGLWSLVNGGILDLTLNLSVGATLDNSSAGISPIVANISNYLQGATDPNLDQLAWTQAMFTDYTATMGTTVTPRVTLDTYAISAGSRGSGGAFQTACTPIPGPPSATNNTTPSTIGATPGGTAYCDPIYPFQYGSSFNGASAGGVTLNTDFFYDAPQGPWVASAFRGIALLSTVTYDTNSLGAITGDILTVYQGVNYGFTLSSTPGATTTGTPTVVTTQLAQDVPEPGTLVILAVGLVAVLLAQTGLARRS